MNRFKMLRLIKELNPSQTETTTCFWEGKKAKGEKESSQGALNISIISSFQDSRKQNMDKVKAMGLGHADTPKSPNSKYAQCNLRSQRRDTGYQQIEPNL